MVGLVLNGLITRIVEELYFRGFLLPRLSRFKQWAPVVNVGLCAAYHLFWSWKLVAIALAVMPAVFIVWKRKCVVLAMLTHCILNTLGLAWGIVGLVSS